LADAAWRTAARVSSPIDAGCAMIAVAARARETGWTDTVEKWSRERRESWIRSGIVAHAASARFLGGEPARARELLSEAQAEYERTTEWRRPLVADALRCAEVLAMLAPSPTNDLAGAAGSLHAWALVDPPRRGYAAAWACAHLASQSVSSNAQAMLVAEAMRSMPLLLPLQQMEVLAVLAPRLTSPVARASCLATVAGMTSALTNAGSSSVACEVTMRAAQVYRALGSEDRPDAMLAEAAARIERGATGDDLIPRVWLAEGLLGMARADQARAAFIAGLADAARLPGFNREMALARTLAAMAASGIDWTPAEVERSLKMAN
jgi:hypothetical protein